MDAGTTIGMDTDTSTGQVNFLKYRIRRTLLGSSTNSGPTKESLSGISFICMGLGFLCRFGLSCMESNLISSR